ncbi:unnamed protein product [Danaus chrysippus]|uniref:(African queen) hypothetical protein n=1 Tax=Danaus chrysippus TaxID=151541 RepID=A0A8J2QQD4_9NEOP|nr:unnamed protein product [Danaus chrysippus]
MIGSNCFGLLIFMVIASTSVIAFRNIIRVPRTDDDDDDRPYGVGEPEEKDPTKTTYYMMAEQSLRKYEEDSQDGTRYNVLKVNKVTEQVVSGTLTKIDFDAAPLNCDADSEPDHFCQFKSISNILHCHSEVYSKSWEGLTEIKSNCSKKKLHFRS